MLVIDPTRGWPGCTAVGWGGLDRKLPRDEVKGEYGWPRVWKELLARGIRVGKARVHRLMYTHGIKARSKRTFVVTTDSKHDLPIADNLLARDFMPAAPDRVWSSDITCIATDEGWLYLAAVIDLFSRQVVGWSMAAAHAGQPGDRRAAHGVVQASPGAGIDLLLGPQQPILQPLVPGRAGQLQHAVVDESQRQLLG